MRVVAVTKDTLTVTREPDPHAVPMKLLEPHLTWRDYLRWSNEYPSFLVLFNADGRRIG